MKTYNLLVAVVAGSLFSLGATAQDVYQNIENEAANRFLNEVTYIDQASESRVAAYATVGTGRRDWPADATITLSEASADSLVLTIGLKSDFTDAWTVGVSPAVTAVSVRNLIPYTMYHYKLLTLQGDTVALGHVYPRGQLRMIGVPVGGFNIRDMGGWPTIDGRMVKYGKLFRGSELNGGHVADSISIAWLRQAGVGAEIDVRYTGENVGAGISAFGFQDSTMVNSGEPYTYLYTNNLSIVPYQFEYESFQNRMRLVFRFINMNLRQGKGVYMHCAWGVDRTGLMALLFEGLLGVGYDGLMKDYELSYFVGSSKPKSNMDNVMNYISNLNGNTWQEKFNYFFINKVKVKQEEIDFFRSQMLTEAPLTISYSGTLPVMFVSCNDSIKSKYDYVDATFFIDNMGTEGFESVGSALEPLPMQIRGRGNWTWFGPFEKKAYKIKLDEGMPLLGMGSNKHWALLAHADGGEKAYFRNTAGFELGRLAGLPFTPHQQPIEVVLNGEYKGLYFLTETVRVGKRRVNITEQDDYETDPEIVSGAWLVEIDNADEPEHQVIPSLDNTELWRFCVTWHSPEQLSEEQYNYLYNEWTEILRTVYLTDKTSTEWEEHFDLDLLVRYYLVNEMIDHVEAFLGSCYLHKDQGEQQWKMGPMWDLGHAFNEWHPKNTFIWQYKHETEDDWEPSILEELVKFPHLQQLIKNTWMNIANELYKEIVPYLEEFAVQIAAATVNDRQRWPNYGTPDVEQTLQQCLNDLEEKRQFLVSEWGNPRVVTGIQEMTTAKSTAVLYNLNGQQLKGTTAPGLYIKDGRKYLRR